jgi:GNAT superfamily N-acetyltransferase
VIRRAIAAQRNAGWRGLWFGALATAKLYRRLDVTELDLSSPPPLAPAPEGYTFGFLDPEDAAGLGRLGHWTEDEVAARHARGERCFVARTDGEIAAARWITVGRGPAPYLERQLSLTPDEAYQYENYTDPALRGRGISPAGGTRLAHALAAEGFSRIVAVALREVHAAVRAGEKVGYVRTGRVGYMGIGPWRRHFGSR